MIPARNATLGLLAVHPDGTEQRAILTLPDAPVGTTELGTILSFQTSQRLSDLTVDDLDIQHRAEWDLIQSPTFSTEFFGRLELYIQAEEQLPYRVRWMATAPFGTFYETTATATDWAPAHVTVDDDAVVVVTRCQRVRVPLRHWYLIPMPLGRSATKMFGWGPPKRVHGSMAAGIPTTVQSHTQASPRLSLPPTMTPSTGCVSSNGHP